MDTKISLLNLYIAKSEKRGNNRTESDIFRYFKD